MFPVLKNLTETVKCRHLLVSSPQWNDLFDRLQCILYQKEVQHSFLNFGNFEKHCCRWSITFEILLIVCLVVFLFSNGIGCQHKSLQALWPHRNYGKPQEHADIKNTALYRCENHSQCMLRSRAERTILRKQTKNNYKLHSTLIIRLNVE